MKVWVIVGHSEDDSWPEGIYSTAELATTHIKTQEALREKKRKSQWDISWSVEEWYLDDVSYVGKLLI